MMLMIRAILKFVMLPVEFELDVPFSLDTHTNALGP
jgi:hypothetical protein